MRITYLVFWGIIGMMKRWCEAIYEQTNGLIDRGHKVKILVLNIGRPPVQYHFKAEIIQVERFDGMIPVSDIIVACFGGAGLAACQVIKEIPFYMIHFEEGNLINHPGYKGICENSYRLPLNLLCSSKGVKELLEKRFHRRVHLVHDSTNPVLLEDLFSRALKVYSKRPPQNWHPWEKVLMLSPDDPWAHYRYGLDLQEMGAVERAKEELKRAIELEPNFILANKDFGKLLVSLGEYKAGIEHLKMTKEKLLRTKKTNTFKEAQSI